MRARSPQPQGAESRISAETPIGFNRETTLLALQTAALLAMALSVATRLWQDHLWFGFVLTGVTVAAWVPEFRARRVRIWWFTYVAGIFLYTLLRALADETFIPIRTDYVIDFDELLLSPVSNLQDARLDYGFPKLFDYIGIAVHWSFFIGPHAMAVAVFFFRRKEFPAYAALLVITMWIGLLLFFLLPTVPPWLAGEQGDLPGVERIMDSTVRESLGDATTEAGGAYDDLYAALGEPNSVAAMPSIHMGVTFAMFLWARRYARRFAWPLLAYTALMALALVYLGEHYVADELAGLAVALVAWAIVLRVPKLAPEPHAAR